MKTGITPAVKEPRKQAVKHINYKPSETKGAPERAHLRDQHASMAGPTLDNPKFCMVKFDGANQPTSTEWNTEKQMTQKGRIKTLYD